MLDRPLQGKQRWTVDDANRLVGRQVEHPISHQEKVTAIHSLARDDEVAAQVTGDLLRRPDVAFGAMSDDRARQQVNHAKVERGRQAREDFEEPHELAPILKRFERTAEFLDLITARHAFVAKAGRTVPGLRDRRLGEDERDLVHRPCGHRSV
nr:DUF6192 family protein [Streptomyces sp. KL118A]